MTCPTGKLIICGLMPFRSPHPDVHVPDVPLSDFVLGGVDAHDRPALVCAVSGRALTFGELRHRVRGLAAGLSRRIGKGDVVAIWGRTRCAPPGARGSGCGGARS